MLFEASIVRQAIGKISICRWSQHAKKCAIYACSQKQGKLRLLHIALWTLPDLRRYCRYVACWVLWYRLSKQLVPMNSWRNRCSGSGKSQLHRNITKIICASNSCSFYNAFSFTSARLHSSLSLRPTDRSIGVLRPILHIVGHFYICGIGSQSVLANYTYKHNRILHLKSTFARTEPNQLLYVTCCIWAHTWNSYFKIVLLSVGHSWFLLIH